MDLIAFIQTVTLASLRIGPTLAGAGPFALMRIPASIRVFLALGLAAGAVAVAPPGSLSTIDQTSDFVTAAASELLIGLILATTLHITFGAIQLAGRVIDIQAGFGLALVADPNLRGQMPLIGTLMAYAAAIVFFTTDGVSNLILLWTQSFRSLPVGTPLPELPVDTLIGLIGTVHVMALGLAGLILLVLFLIDAGVGVMSRTLPQMNVLVLGFQIKTIAVLLLLPVVIPASAALYLQLVRAAFEAAASWL